MSIKAMFRSFAGGEITEEAIGRIDLTKYQTGLALARNFITLPHGPAMRRLGFGFIGEARESNAAVRLVPFQYSADQTVVLEFGNFYVRFWINGAAVLEGNKPCTVSGATATCTGHGYGVGDDVFIGGRFLRVATTTTNTYTCVDRWGAATNPPAGATTCARVYQVPTPYASTSLFDLRYAQDSDVLTISHPSYATRELRRLGAASWQLATVSFVPSVTVPTGVSVTPTIGTPGNTSPQSYVVTTLAADGVTESLQSATVTTANNLTVAGNYNTVAWSAVSGASAYNVYKGRAGAFGYIGQTTSTSIVDDNVSADATKTPPQDVYELNTAAGKYPTAVTYHEQRRWFAGTNTEPQTVWATRNGTQSNLTSSVPVQDDDGLKFRIASRQQNAIRHLVPLADLIALTVGGVFRIYADNAPAITPSTLTTKAQGSIGASDVQPVTTSSTILYVQAQGSRVRELAYQWQSSTFASIDISIMAPHLFDGYTIVDMAFQRSPVPVLWCVRSDGVLLGMTYVPEQQVYGWHQHTTAGAFESVCVVTEGLDDVVYALIRREIDSRTVRYIERLAARFVYSDAEFVDYDPFWDQVLVYLPLDGSGDTFTDLGPLAASNTLAVEGGGAAETFAQNSSDTLWGVPTLQMTQPGAGGGDSVRLLVSNGSKTLSAAVDLCVEWFWKQSSWAAATTPIHAWFTRGTALVDAPLLAGRSDPPSGLHFRTTNNSPGETLEVDGYSAGTWRHVAIQYIAADFKAYVYIAGVKVGEYTASLNAPSTGFRLIVGDFVGTTPPGPETYGYDLRLAQLRVTAANRYGNNPTISPPQGPYPTR